MNWVFQGFSAALKCLFQRFGAAENAHLPGSWDDQDHVVICWTCENSDNSATRLYKALKTSIKTWNWWKTGKDGSGARPKVERCAVTMAVRSCFIVDPLLWVSLDQMLRLNWIVDAVIYIFGAWSDQYPCRLSFMSLHWFTNMPHQHSVLMGLFL